MRDVIKVCILCSDTNHHIGTGHCVPRHCIAIGHFYQVSQPGEVKDVGPFMDSIAS